MELQQMFDLLVKRYLVYTDVVNAVLAVGIASVPLLVWSILSRPPNPRHVRGNPTKNVAI